MMLVLLLGAPGCGGGSGPVGHVSGKVTFQGQPVREGRVTFEGPDSAEGLLTADGSYTLTKPLPLGEYGVTVMPLVSREQVDGKGPVVGVSKPAPDIPEKYRTIGETTLKATVIKGKNEHKFDMQP
jgi:hypothetical protein